MTTTRARTPNPPSAAPSAAPAASQEVFILPERDTLTLLSGNMFPTVSPSTMLDPNQAGTTGTTGATGTSAPTGVTNTVGDTTDTTTGMANSAVQSAPTQTGATAQNVLSPNATAYATQSQTAPAAGS